MANLRDLAARLTALNDSIPVQSNAISIKIATAIINDLVLVTPVDTSQALSNWQITLVSANASRIPPYVYGFKGSSQAASAEIALAQALAVLKNKKPGQSIWIQNTLPYIRRLNDGYSSQAPAAFVERAVLIGRNIAEQSGITINGR